MWQGWNYRWDLWGCCWGCCALKEGGFIRRPLTCAYPIQGSAYSLLKDQALTILEGLEFVLSYSGLGLLSLPFWEPSTKFLTPLEDSFLEQFFYLPPEVALIYPTKGASKQLKLFWPSLLRGTTVIQHVLWTSLWYNTRTQFAVPLTRIDPVCSSDSECHLPRFLSTTVLGVEMNVGARVTLDTEFFCRCYAVQPQDFSCCRIRVTLDTVYNCWCYAFICWNGSKVVGLLQTVLLEIPLNCIYGEECSPSYDQVHTFEVMQICTQVQLFV